MVNFYDSQIRRELESEQTAMMDVEADYVAAIDGKEFWRVVDCLKYVVIHLSHAVT